MYFKENKTNVKIKDCISDHLQTLSIQQIPVLTVFMLPHFADEETIISRLNLLVYDNTLANFNRFV